MHVWQRLQHTLATRKHADDTQRSWKRRSQRYLHHHLSGSEQDSPSSKPEEYHGTRESVVMLLRAQEHCRTFETLEDLLYMVCTVHAVLISGVSRWRVAGRASRSVAMACVCF